MFFDRRLLLLLSYLPSYILIHLLISNKIQDKMNKYAPLLRNMQIPDYRFEMLPIIVGTLGYVPLCLFKYMNDLGLEKKEATKHKENLKKIFLKFLTLQTPSININFDLSIMC